MSTQVATPSELEIVVTREVDAPARLVWRAYHEPALVRRWLLGPPGWEMPVCEIDARVGGKYRYVWRKGDMELAMGGQYREIEAPKRNVATQLFDGAAMGSGQIVKLELVEKGGQTKIVTTIVHNSKEERDQALATGMTEGMEHGYKRLDALVKELSGG